MSCRSWLGTSSSPPSSNSCSTCNHRRVCLIRISTRPHLQLLLLMQSNMRFSLPAAAVLGTRPSWPLIPEEIECLPYHRISAQPAKLLQVMQDSPAWSFAVLLQYYSTRIGTGPLPKALVHGLQQKVDEACHTAPQAKTLDLCLVLGTLWLQCA